MTKLLSLFAGPYGWVAYLVAGLVIFAAGSGAGWGARGLWDAPIISGLKADVANAKTRTAECVAIHEKGRADGAEKVISALLQSAADVTAAINTLAAKAEARGKTLDQFLKDIANAPESHACGNSAAELAYRRSVQPH